MEYGVYLTVNFRTGLPEALCVMDGYTKKVIFSQDTCRIIGAKVIFF